MMTPIILIRLRVDPATTRIDAGVEIGQDARIEPGDELSRIGHGAVAERRLELIGQLIEAHDNYLLIRSDYFHWFGTYRGTLPGGIELKEAYGVRERHDAVW